VAGAAVKRRGAPPPNRQMGGVCSTTRPACLPPCLPCFWIPLGGQRWGLMASSPATPGRPPPPSLPAQRNKDPPGGGGGGAGLVERHLLCLPLLLGGKAMQRHTTRRPHVLGCARRLLLVSYPLALRARNARSSVRRVLKRIGVCGHPLGRFGTVCTFPDVNTFC